MANNCDSRRPIEVLIHEQPTPVLRRTQDAKEVLRHQGGLYVHRRTIVGEVERPVPRAGHYGIGVGTVLPVLHQRHRVSRVVEEHQLSRVGVREPFQQDSVHDAEDCSGGADTQGKEPNHQYRKAGAFDGGAKRVAYVLYQRSHQTPSRFA